LTKYNAIRTNVDGVWFASKAEASRYSQLKLLERAGEIKNLILQPSYPIVIAGKKICTYRADFEYEDASGKVTEDVKGVRTPVYKIKKKLVEAVHGVTITEVGK